MTKIIQISGSWPNLCALDSDGNLYTQALTDAGYAKEIEKAVGAIGNELSYNELSYSEQYCWIRLVLNEYR